jgi:hypothetical protein
LNETLAEKEHELAQLKIQKQYEREVQNHTSVPEVSDMRPTFMDMDRREV